MSKSIAWLAERFCLLCALLFCALILVQSLRVSARLPLPVLLGALCALGVLWLCWNFWPLGAGATTAALFFLRVLLALLVIFVIDALPIQDFATMYSAAQDMARGSRDYLNSTYFYNWAYQTGFAFYESLPLRLLGAGQRPLQILNALWLGGIGALVYQIALLLLPRRSAVSVSLLYALYPAPYFLAAVLTNQHLAVFLYYLALWLLLRREPLPAPTALLAGLLLALGNAVRPIGVVVLLAALCWRAVHLLRTGGRERSAELLRGVFLALGFVLLFALLSRAVVWSGLNPEGLGNNQPLWKFVLGLNQDSDGGWNQADYDAYLSLPPDEAERAMRSVVRERALVGPSKLLGLFLRKIMVMWGDNEYMFWGFGHLEAHKPLGPLTIDQWTQVLARGDKGVYLIAFALAVLGLAALLRRGPKRSGALLLSFLVCGYCAVHLIVEVQARYRYFLMPAVFLLSGCGLAVLTREKTS